jgi:hypothetical protein
LLASALLADSVLAVASGFVGFERNQRLLLLAPAASNISQKVGVTVEQSVKHVLPGRCTGLLYEADLLTYFAAIAATVERFTRPLTLAPLAFA